MGMCNKFISNAKQWYIYIVQQNYVKAHKGIEGNEHADMLAKAGASNYKLKGSSTDSARYKPY